MTLRTDPARQTARRLPPGLLPRQRQLNLPKIPHPLRYRNRRHDRPRRYIHRPGGNNPADLLLAQIHHRQRNLLPRRQKINPAQIPVNRKRAPATVRYRLYQDPRTAMRVSPGKHPAPPRRGPPTAIRKPLIPDTLPSFVSTATGAVSNSSPIPSRRASSISQSLAGISSRERRYTITTSRAPNRKAVRAASTAVFPPPITATRSPTTGDRFEICPRSPAKLTACKKGTPWYTPKASSPSIPKRCGSPPPTPNTPPAPGTDPNPVPPYPIRTK